jgi:hypothetical protein
MKNNLKKTLVITALITGGFLFYGNKKLKSAKQVMHNVKVGVKKVSNVNLTWRNLIFDVVLTLQNLTNIDFGATLGSKIIIKQVRVYSEKGEYLGKADTQIHQIDLPANTTVEMPQIRLNLDLKKSINEFIANSDAYLSNDFSKLNYKVDVSVFSKILTLEA